MNTSLFTSQLGKNVGDHSARTDKTGSTKTNQVNHTFDGDFSTNHTAFANVVLRTDSRGASQLVGISESRGCSISTASRHDRIRGTVGAVEQQDTVAGEDRQQGTVVGQITTFGNTQTTLKTEVTCEDVSINRISSGVLDALKDRLVGQQLVKHSGSKNSRVRTDTDLVSNSSLQGQDVFNGVSREGRPSSRAGGSVVSVVESGPASEA